MNSTVGAPVRDGSVEAVRTFDDGWSLAAALWSVSFAGEQANMAAAPSVAVSTVATRRLLPWIDPNRT
jgi:hypothetical protein